MKKIFIAHSLGLSDKVEKYVEKLEKKGHEVYFPARDTPQKTTAKQILEHNLAGLKRSDEVHVLWDGSSYGTIFDLGSAYALDKPIKVIYVTSRTWYSHLLEHLNRFL